MKRKHPLRRIMIGTAATASGVVLLLALKQPGNTVAGGVVAGRLGRCRPPARRPPGTGPGRRDRRCSVTSPTRSTATVQVQLTLSGGRITGAQAVKAPSADARSRQIAADAIPKLNQAAVTAQSAQIDAVSGATLHQRGLHQVPAERTRQGRGRGGGGLRCRGFRQRRVRCAGRDARGRDAAGGAAGSGTGCRARAPAPAPVAPRRRRPSSATWPTPSTARCRSGSRSAAARSPRPTPSRRPDADANSRQIAADAVPKLNQAAVTAQSAQIDAVSGASYTSEGYIKSLQSALDKAGL